MKSLKAAHHELSDTRNQIQLLSRLGGALPSFQERLTRIGLYPLTPTKIEILQINVGKMCNQTCAHCHVDAGPDRQEIMSRETMEYCLEAIQRSDIHTVDLTGGAPEMNPDFRWFVEELSELGARTIVRSNLTILTVNNRYRQLPQFFADHKITVISSLPCYTAENTDQQRGQGVFNRSIEALQMLNAVGYGQAESVLELYLVYNPLGPSLPPPQEDLKNDYQRVLKDRFGIVFNDLYCITNMPISRFLEHLLQLGKYGEYMRTLVEAFNPAAAEGVMCRNTISVGWDGNLYDCDFNQMLGLEMEPTSPQHIRNFDLDQLTDRRIRLNQHCYGCTAGTGSSCGGEILK